MLCLTIIRGDSKGRHVKGLFEFLFLGYPVFQIASLWATFIWFVFMNEQVRVGTKKDYRLFALKVPRVGISRNESRVTSAPASPTGRSRRGGTRLAVARRSDRFRSRNHTPPIFR